MDQPAFELDPGFRLRRVKRPNPMDKWDADTQAAIARDFDELVSELRKEHRDASSRALDNEYASRLRDKFLGDEDHGRTLLKSGRGLRSFLKGTFLLGRSRFAQFCLGHEVLHGSYANHPDPTFSGRQGWYMPLFILDKHWRYGHNRFHHQTPGVFGLDPEATPVNHRVSNDFYAEKGDRATVLFNSVALIGFTLFAIGIVEAKKYSETHEDAWEELLESNKALAKKEFVSIPLEAGLKAPRVLAGNLLSFFVAELISGALGRSTHVRNDSVSLHIDEYDPANRAHFYINSLLNAGNVDYPGDRIYIGGFDKHIEHHLFPFLSSRKLDEASGRIRALCARYDLPYNEGSMPSILAGGVLLDMKLLFSA